MIMRWMHLQKRYVKNVACFGILGIVMYEICRMLLLQIITAVILILLLLVIIVHEEVLRETINRIQTRMQQMKTLVRSVPLY